MAYGRWGRVPIGNFVVTNCLFASVSTTLFLHREGNRLRAKLSSRRAVTDAAVSREAVLGFLAAGYDRFNIGGGPKNLAGFINVDCVAHNKVQREVVADVRDLSFIPSACASQVHSNHVLEHFPDDELRHQLAEYARILRPGGILSVRCPNALGVALGFWFEPVLESNREEFLRLGFPPDEDSSNPADVWAHKDVFGLLHWFYGDVGKPGGEHLTLLTPTKLRKSLVEAGFFVAVMTEPEAVNIVVVCQRVTTAHRRIQPEAEIQRSSADRERMIPGQPQSPRRPNGTNTDGE